MELQDLVQLQFASRMGTHDGVWGMFLSMVVMMLVTSMKDIARLVPVLVDRLRARVVGYAKTKVEHVTTQSLISTSVPLSERHAMNRFRMVRVFQGEDTASATQATQAEETMGMVDAVLAQVTKLQNVPSFSLVDRGKVMATYKDKPFQITRDIFCKIDSIAWSRTEDVERIQLTLISESLSASEIASYVRNLYTNYLEEMKNSLGDKIFFFDQKCEQMPTRPTIGATTEDMKRMIISTSPKNLSFTMTPFYSNKRFSNIYGKEVRLIEKRVRFFLERRDWYEDKGVPYQLGLLLSGIPGAGKTSIIRALANLTKRHIVNVNFANITTATQLKHLFYSDKLHVHADSTVCPFFIPMDQRLYVLEEIDAIGDVVRKRDPKTRDAHTPVEDEVTLAEILTVLDGTIEVPGRILIMTTNHPDLLDPALIRPGRIDVQARFGNADRHLIADMFEAYLERSMSPAGVQRLPDEKLSPAQVGQVLFRHFDKDSTEEDILRDFWASVPSDSEDPEETTTDATDRRATNDAPMGVMKLVVNGTGTGLPLEGSRVPSPRLKQAPGPRVTGHGVPIASQGPIDHVHTIKNTDYFREHPVPDTMRELWSSVTGVEVTGQGPATEPDPHCTILDHAEV